MNSISRYVSLWFALFKASAISEMEYRANFAGKIVTDFIWYVAQFSFFEVLFVHSTQVSGWTQPQVRVFMGVLFFVDGLYMIFVSDNLDQFSQKITKGELDMVLAKPVNSQFMMSLSHVNVAYVINVFCIVLYVIWACSKLPEAMTWWTVCLGVVGALCGFLTMYSFRFLLASVALVYTNSESLTHVWHQIFRLSQRPDAMFPMALRMIIFTVLPIGFIVSVPARLLLNMAPAWLILGSLGVAMGMLWLSAKAWNSMLKRYVSASS